MPNDEYRELIEFRGRKFDGVDARFGQVDARLAEMAKQEGRGAGTAGRDAPPLRRDGRESLDQVGTVAEGVVNLDEKLERFRESVASEFSETQSMIRLSYTGLDSIDSRAPVLAAGSRQQPETQKAQESRKQNALQERDNLEGVAVFRCSELRLSFRCPGVQPRFTPKPTPTQDSGNR